MSRLICHMLCPLVVGMIATASSVFGGCYPSSADEPFRVLHDNQMIVEARVIQVDPDKNNDTVIGTLEITRVFAGNGVSVGQRFKAMSQSRSSKYLTKLPIRPELQRGEQGLWIILKHENAVSGLGVSMFGLRWPVRDPTSVDYQSAQELAKAAEIVSGEPTRLEQLNKLKQFARNRDAIVSRWAIESIENQFANMDKSVRPFFEELFLEKDISMATLTAADMALGHLGAAQWYKAEARLERLDTAVRSSTLSHADAVFLAGHLRQLFRSDSMHPDFVAANHRTHLLLQLGVANKTMPLGGRIGMARAIRDSPTNGSEDQAVFETGVAMVNSDLPIELREEGVAILRSRRMNEARLEHLKELLEQTIEVPLRRGVIAILEKPHIFKPYGPGVTAPNDIVRDEKFARRELSKDEYVDIRKHCADLQDKKLKLAQRLVSAGAARYYGHARFLPALLFVLHDKQENHYLRRECATALGGIADRSVIDELIELVHDRNFDVAVKASQDLSRLTGQRIGEDVNLRSPDDEDREAVYREWKSWWKENRDTAELNWTDKANAPLFKRMPTPEDVAP